MLDKAFPRQPLLCLQFPFKLLPRLFAQRQNSLKLILNKINYCHEIQFANSLIRVKQKITVWERYAVTHFSQSLHWEFLNGMVYNREEIFLIRFGISLFIKFRNLRDFT